MKTIVFDKGTVFETYATVESGKVLDLSIKKTYDTPKLGDIYIARIINVVQGLDAAFVDIGCSKSGFLYKGDSVAFKRDKKVSTNDCFKSGETIIVQIIKEEEGDKGAKLSQLLSFNGEKLVYLPLESHIGISKKIKDSLIRDRLSGLAKKFLEDDGLIFRTNVELLSDEEITNEFYNLKQTYADIKTKSNTANGPKLVHTNEKFKNDVVKLLVTHEEYEFVTNDEDLFLEIKKKILDRGLKPSEKMKYKAFSDLYNDHHIKSNLMELFKTRVKLKGGAYIDIEEGEALTAVDVNSGSYVSGKNYDKTAYDVNISALLKTLNEVRLRNIGGMIIIDSINIMNDKLKDKFKQKVSEICRNSGDNLTFHGITKLGLIQITKQKSGESLKKMLTTPSKKMIFAREFVMEFVIEDINRKVISEAENTACSNIAIILREDVFPMVVNNRFLRTNCNGKAIKYVKSTEKFDDFFKLSTDPKYFIK